jgi:SSS family transporter
MTDLDWLVMLGTLLLIVVYGVWKTTGAKNIEGYLKGDNTMKWGTIGLSVMATQASAITFLSTPGQAYESGMAFVQNYFGLPIALIIVSAVFIPLYYRLKVFTAYEFLEKRFDFKTRLLGASLFLVQRGLAAGITIYAPAIIISTMLEWNLSYTILFVGILVIIYTVSGGTKAVSITQKYQMAVIMIGMFIAFGMIIYMLPENLGFGKALHVAGKLGKLEAVDFSLDFSKRYTFWSGITGGLFLALSYFGTDQSQVQRYISGSSVAQSRMGLMFNAILKVPMQFFILLVGVMVFVFYQYVEPPVFFKEVPLEQVRNSQYGEQMVELEEAYSRNHSQKIEAINQMISAMESDDQSLIEQSTSNAQAFDEQSKQIRSDVKNLMVTYDPDIEVKDSDYVFLTFIINYLPHGIIGLLLAVIFSAAMSSTSSELNALGSTTLVDFYKRSMKKDGSDNHYLIMSKWFTAAWGILAIIFAFLAYLAENLIEMVNIVGSLFYGTILGIFIVGFFIKSIKGNAVFYGAILAEIVVMTFHIMTVTEVISLSYLFYNVIGCFLVIIFSFFLQILSGKKF